MAKLRNQSGAAISRKEMSTTRMSPIRKSTRQLGQRVNKTTAKVRRL